MGKIIGNLRRVMKPTHLRLKPYPSPQHQPLCNLNNQLNLLKTLLAGKLQRASTTSVMAFGL